jgi:hypothetical protein
MSVAEVKPPVGHPVIPGNVTANEIWSVLSPINVNEHVKKKGNLSYLSWPFAYQTMMENFPEFNFTFLDDQLHPDDCVTVHVTCWIGNVKREMWLPCMDNKNNAIKGPDARDISDTKMRCLVKCMAMFGVGFYIYAGEDLPSQAETAPEPPKELSKEEQEKLAAVALTMTTLIEGVTDRDELKAYWKDNKKALLELQAGNQDLYDAVLKDFKAQGKTIAKATEGSE